MKNATLLAATFVMLSLQIIHAQEYHPLIEA